MSNEKKAVKVGKMVRRMVPANSIAWVPGTPLPPELQELINVAVTENATKLIAQQDEFLAKYVPPGPVETSKIVDMLFHQLSNVRPKQGLEAVGIFINGLKERFATKLSVANSTMDMAREALNATEKQVDTLADILSGRLRVTPAKQSAPFASGAQMASPNNKKDNDGEAVVNQRHTR